VRLRAVLWDLDGTLTDSVRFVVDTANRVIEAHGGSPLAFESVGAMTGLPLEAIFRLAWPDLSPDLAQLYRTEYRDIYDREIIAGLTERGWRVGVHALDESFPAPTPAALRAARATFGGLADGSVVTYSGPARVNIGAPFTVTFTVRNANNTPGTGTFLVSFGNASTGGSKTSSGTLDPGGRFTINMPGAALPGNYPFVVNYKGQQGQVAILRVG